MRTRAAKRNKKKELGLMVRVREAATLLCEARLEIVASDLEWQKCLHIRSISLVIGSSVWSVETMEGWKLVTGQSGGGKLLVDDDESQF